MFDWLRYIWLECVHFIIDQRDASIGRMCLHGASNSNCSWFCVLQFWMDCHFVLVINTVRIRVIIIIGGRKKRKWKKKKRNFRTRRATSIIITSKRIFFLVHATNHPSNVFQLIASVKQFFKGKNEVFAASV